MPTRARAKLPMTYIGMWLLMMSFALAYIGGMAVQPDTVAVLMPPIKIGALLLDEDDSELRKSASETETLRRQLFSARAELNGVRGELARRADRETTLALKLAAVETREARLEESQAADSGPVGKPMPAIKAIPTVKTVAVRPADKVRSLPAPPAQSAVERLANSGAALPPPVETASVNPPAKAEGPQAAVQLGTGPSVDSLRLNWTLLSQRHQGVLQKLQPRYTARGDSGNGSAGAAYDLIAGPVSTSAEAQRICDALRAQNVSCKVGAFGGNAL